MEKVTLRGFDKLARSIREISARALVEYTPVVDAIILSECRDAGRIEHTLDGILDFCHNAEMLTLYKRLCRYYFEMDPDATVFYVNAYREMWDSETQQESSRPPGRGPRLKTKARPATVTPTTRSRKRA